MEKPDPDYDDIGRIQVSLTTFESPSGSDFDPESLGVACVAVLVGDSTYFFEFEQPPSAESDEDISEDVDTSEDVNHEEIDRVFELLRRADTVVGVNDFFVDALSAYGDISDIEFVGLQSRVSDVFGKRVSLNNIASNTVGKERPEVKTLPLEWKSGRKNTVKKALEKDVEILREIDEHLRREGSVTVKDPESLEEERVVLL